MAHPAHGAVSTPATAAGPIIRFSHATFAFANRVALEDITLDILEGEFAGVIGVSPDNYEPTQRGVTIMLSTIADYLNRPQRIYGEGAVRSNPSGSDSNLGLLYSGETGKFGPGVKALQDEGATLTRVQEFSRRLGQYVLSKTGGGG